MGHSAKSTNTHLPRNMDRRVRTPFTLFRTALHDLRGFESYSEVLINAKRSGPSVCL